MKVAVTSRSFSKNEFLKNKLMEKFPDSYFNEKGMNFSKSELIEFLKPADAAIIALEKIDHEVFRSLPNLKVLSKYGVGLDNINFNSIKDHGIKWSYTAGTNRRGVAELALQMMLILIRQSYQANLLMNEGQWSPQFGNNLTNKKIGILGLGHVGKELVQLLSPFDCEISCCENQPDKNFISANKLKLVSIEELFSTNDVVSIHIPLDENNRMLISDRILSLMQPHSILINTARGGLVDEASLLEKLTNKKFHSAGFDVFESEPYTNLNLLTLPNFYSTPHIGGSSIESIQSMGLAAITGLSEAKKIL